ncbi:MAG TPA: HAD family acid phosphatase [Gemmatimonadaceae bacterium]|nr:HAD family acid phosphatase [Gemmatimonadaceae bacterium]
MRLSRLSLLSLLAAACTAPAATPATPATPTPAPSTAAPTAPHDIHWVRASAEHRALFLQIYRHAQMQLEQAASGLPSGAWAVILDADETVLDNSQYQLERARAGLGYSDSSWNAWVRREAAPALPGAAAFTQRVHALGGRVVIVTNRAEVICDPTRANLRAVGIPADLVLCGSGDKNPRFAAVAQGTPPSTLPPLRVVMWVGDNIQDFPGASQQLRTAPDSALAGFGRRWIILPNPMYGSWERNPVR